MADIRDRFVSYGTRPDVYDAPTPLECVTIASEVKRLREEADELAGMLVDLDSYQDIPNGTRREIQAALSRHNRT